MQSSIPILGLTRRRRKYLRQAAIALSLLAMAYGIFDTVGLTGGPEALWAAIESDFGLESLLLGLTMFGIMGSGGMDPMRLIIGGVAGLIVFSVGLVLYPTKIVAADRVALEYVEHCEIGSQAFVRLYAKAEFDADNFANAITVSKQASGTGCSPSAELAANGTYYTEHGYSITIGSTAIASTSTVNASAKWVKPLPVVEKYSGIGRLIMNIMPVVIVGGFIGINGLNIFTMVQGGTENVGFYIIEAIGTLILLLVGLEFTPTVFEMFNDVFIFMISGRLTIMEQFGNLSALITGFGPVLFVLGFIALFAVSGFMAFNAYKKGM